MKRAIVTGGGGLIGSGIIEALLVDGWTVASFDIKETTTAARHILCDVSNETSVAAAFDQLGWKGVELLVNNAGIAGPVTGPIHTLSLARWRKVTDSHLTGAFLMTRAAVPLMGEGTSIVNMVSTRAFMSEPDTEAYAAAKGGLKMLTRNIASEYGSLNIQCNGLGPGYIETPQTAPLREPGHPFNSFILAKTPANRWGTTQDLKGPAVFLASPASDFVNGHVLYVDGGILAYIGKQP